MQPLRIAECGMPSELYTRSLLAFCKQHPSTLVSLDHAPAFSVENVQKDFPEWEAINDFAINGIATIDRCDVAILHEDANWYTVYQSLVAILNHWCNGDIYRFPVILIHHTDEPYAYRDHYRSLNAIPPIYQQATQDGHTALYASNPHNGVRKAIEDFCTQHNATHALHLGYIAAKKGLCILAPETANPSILSFIQLLHKDNALLNITETLLSTSESTDLHRKLKTSQENNVALQESCETAKEEKRLMEITLRSIRKKKESLELTVESIERKMHLLEQEMHTLTMEKYRMHDRVLALQEENEQISYALNASNASRMKQSSLLTAELETTQERLSDTYNKWVHMHQTLSWKITSPLRKIGGLRKRRSISAFFDKFLYAVFGALKDLWEDFDKPFPQLVHAIRYCIFKRWKPRSHVHGPTTVPQTTRKKTAPQKKKLSQPKHIYNLPVTPAHVIPHTCAAIVHGNTFDQLTQTLRSLLAQSLPLSEIIVLFREEDQHVTQAMDTFPEVKFVERNISNNITTLTPLPYICFVQSGSVLASDFIQLGSHFLESNPTIQTITWNIDDDIPPTPITIPFNDILSLSQPIMVRSSYISTIHNTPIAYVPVANEVHSALYTAVPQHV